MNLFPTEFRSGSNCRQSWGLTKIGLYLKTSYRNNSAFWGAIRCFIFGVYFHTWQSHSGRRACLINFGFHQKPNHCATASQNRKVFRNPPGRNARTFESRHFAATKFYLFYIFSKNFPIILQ